MEAVTLAQAGVQGFATQLANVLQNGYESEVGHLKGEDAFRRFALDVYLSLREDTSDISEGYIALHDLSKHVAAEGVVQVLGAFAEDMVAPKDSRSLKHRADFSDPAQALQILGKRMAQLNNPDVKSGLRHLGEQAIARQLPQHGYSLTRIADELQLASVAQQVGLGTQFKEASRSGSYGRN
ncbi:MAG: hypothetical protein H6922_04245 [Pseudomonadaceae bacterium]|nr:hypothetical protein [Pseudomonadaceae bacterium]